MSLVRIARDPAERDAASRAMWEEYAVVLTGEAGLWVQELTGGGLPELGRGGMRGDLWSAEGAEPAGLALWDVVPEVGRRIWLYLTPGHRTASDLARFLDELDQSSGFDGPIASVLDFIPGVSATVQEAAFVPRGFFETERIVVRIAADVPIPDLSLVGGPDLRALEPGDEEALVELLRTAYEPFGLEPGSRPFFRDPRRDAREAVEDVLRGRRGEWLPWASFGVDAGGALVGASLVTRLHAPFITEVAVAPAMRRIGLGYHLVAGSVRVLRERGLEDAHAVIASQDLRSLRLFRRLGFEATGERGVGLWVNRAAFGGFPPSVSVTVPHPPAEPGEADQAPAATSDPSRSGGR